MGIKKSKLKQQKTSTLFYIILAFVVALVGILLASTFTDITGEALAVSPFTVQKISPDTAFTGVFERTAGMTTATVTITDKRAYYTVSLDGENLVAITKGVVENPDFTVSLDYYTLLALQYGEISLQDAIAAGDVKFSSVEAVSVEQLEVVVFSIDITTFS